MRRISTTDRAGLVLAAAIVQGFVIGAVLGVLAGFGAVLMLRGLS